MTLLWDYRARGVALVTVLVSMVVIGLLLSASLFLAFHDHRSGAAGKLHLDAFLAADAGLTVAATSWDGSTFQGVALGQTRRITKWLPDSSGWYQTTLRRTGESIYLVATEGFSADTVGRQHLGMLVTTARPTIPLQAALTVAGRISVEDGIAISGHDAAPPGLAGCDTGSAIGGALVLDSTAADFGEVTITGTPPVRFDQGLSGLLDTTIAWIHEASLRRSADYEFGGPAIRAMGGVLPLDTCGSLDFLLPVSGPGCTGEFPVVVVAGDLSGPALTGRGVLVVLGNLRISGSFEFSGVVIVSGQIQLDAGMLGRGRLWGGMIVASNGPGSSAMTGDWEVSYSRCAINRAIDGLMLVQQLEERSWVNLY